MENVSSGTYILVVTDNLGCEVTETVVLSDVDGTIDEILTNPSCSGSSDGAIQIEVIGGSAPFTYQWVQGTTVISDQEDLSGLSAGEYIVTATDVNGCLFSEAFILADPLPIAVNSSTTPVSCAGSDGTILLDVENAANPIDVTWNGPSGDPGTGVFIENLEAGIYSYDIVDANGCTAMGAVQVIIAPSVDVSETIIDPSCNGSNDGSILIEVTGGVEPILTDWTGPDGFTSIDEDLFNLQAGTYNLVVTDALNCSASFEYTVTDPDPIVSVLLIAQPDCNQSNGSIEAVLAGGSVVGDYTISWTDQGGTEISTNSLLDNVPAGIYTLTASDDNGCSLIETISLSNPGGSILETFFPETCTGDMNGVIDLEISGVAEPYTVDWTGPNGFTSTSEDLSGLSGGLYTYTVTGDDGCVFTGIIDLPNPPALLVMSELSNTCFGLNEGEISISITGGELPYLIVWAGPDGFVSDQTELTNLIPGTYDLIVEDGVGCVFQDSFEIIESPELTLSLTASDVSCFGESDGTVDLSITGGVDPITISWIGDNGFTSDLLNLTGLDIGQYNVTVTDDFGCSADTLVIIEQPDELLVIAEITASGCASDPNSGEISLFPEGGTPGYLVSWTGPNGFTSDLFDITGLESGIYTYVVQDQGGCAISDQIEIEEVDPLLLDITIVEPNCFGESTGSIQPELTGGQGAVTYSWIGPNDFTSNEDTLLNVPAGDYEVVVSDAAGCEVTSTVTLTEPEELTILVNTAASTCDNTNDGFAEAIVSGGTEPYQYAWFSTEGVVSDQAIAENLAQGSYALFVTDDQGCEGSAEAEIEVLFDLEVSAGNDVTACPSDLPVTLSGSITGGDQFYWTQDGDTISSGSSVAISGDSDESISIILIGSNGTCSETDTVQVDILNSPDVDAGEDLKVFVEEVFTLGGSPTSMDEVTYQWAPNPGGVFDDQAANPEGFLTGSQQFTVTVTDENGCQAIDSVFVEVLPDLEITSGFTPNGDGVNDLWIIENIELFPDLVVHVYNRWGVEVFESQGYNSNIAWDGTYSGSVLPSGTYYYTLELNDPRFPDPITGPLTLHR